jgi:hypothetical protein
MAYRKRQPHTCPLSRDVNSPFQCIGVGIAIRLTARQALYAALGFPIFYLVASTILMPGLWIDPLGPLLKVGPIMALVMLLAHFTKDHQDGGCGVAHRGHRRFAVHGHGRRGAVLVTFWLMIAKHRSACGQYPMDLPLGVGSDGRPDRSHSSRRAGQREIKSYPDIDSRVWNRWHGRIVGSA